MIGCLIEDDEVSLHIIVECHIRIWQIRPISANRVIVNFAKSPCEDPARAVKDLSKTLFARLGRFRTKEGRSEPINFKRETA